MLARSQDQGSQGKTVKHRLPYDPNDHAILAPGRGFVDTVLAQEAITDDDTLVFAPTLTTRYQRSTLFLPRTESRVTIDTDLTWEDHNCRCLRLGRLAVVETKTSSTTSCVDRQLWARRYRPIQISKYATGLAALRPDLPATRWRRTLRRYFAAAEHPVAVNRAS